MTENSVEIIIGLIIIIGGVKETVWLTLNQTVFLFGRDKSVISRHIKNVFQENELNKKAVVAKNATVQKGY